MVDAVRAHHRRRELSFCELVRSLDAIRHAYAILAPLLRDLTAPHFQDLRIEGRELPNGDLCASTEKALEES